MGSFIAPRRRLTSAMAALTAATLGLGTLAACTPGSAPAASDSATSACVSLPGAAQRFAEGTTVRVASTLQGVEAERFVASMAEFTECTGVSVELVSVDDLGEALRADDAASIYDLALLPQPGLLRALAEEGRLETMPSSVGANLEAGWDRLWADAVTVREGEDRLLYGAPIMASLKSLVWYSPSAFRAAGYTVPTTWEELEALSTKIAEDSAASQNSAGNSDSNSAGTSEGSSAGTSEGTSASPAPLVPRPVRRYSLWLGAV